MVLKTTTVGLYLGEYVLQEIIFFFDDSGVLHKKEVSGYFVYAGYVFTNREELLSARRRYVHANKKLKERLGRKDELKAAKLERKHRRALLTPVRQYDSVAVAVNIKKVYDYILADKKSICRYKDYIIKRCVKNKLKRLIANGRINPDDDITVSIYIDEQLTGTNGYYDLRDSIREELRYGIVNFDYGTRHESLFDKDVIVNIFYCDSSKNYMIQASDILANRIWTSFKCNKPELRDIENHITLTFP